MTAIRRIYTYVISLAGLLMLSGGLGNLVRVLLDVALRTAEATTASSPERYLREGISGSAAAALVGLPVWALHWRWAQSSARTQPEERASTLRALYLYVVLAACVVAGSQAAGALVRTPIDLMERGRMDLLAGGLPFLAVSVAGWLYHWRVVQEDRRLVGESGGAGTLRRWYLYGAAFLGFVFLLASTSALLADLWRGMLDIAGTARPVVALDDVPRALVALAVWVLHWAVLPRRLDAAAVEADQRSTLRAVGLFLSLAVAVAGTIAGTSQLLYYGLARALGVERPGGVGGNLLEAASTPASLALVFGVGWLYQRAAIRAQASVAGEAPRQVGIRRLYTYLVALLALWALVAGVVRLLWAMVDVGLASAQLRSAPTRWSEEVALGATLIAVALPAWLAHWRPSGAAAVTPSEAGSLSRRLYAYLALIGAMLTLLGSGVGLVYRLFELLLGGERSASLLGDLAHALSAALIAAAVAVYHWRTIRLDGEQARAAQPPAPEAPAPARHPDALLVRLRAPDPATLDTALRRLREAGVAVEVVNEHRLT